MNDGEILELPIAEISPGPAVREKRVDLDHVTRLEPFIDVVPPIIVRATASGWSLIDGAHRRQVAERLKRPTIRAIVVALDDAEALEAAVEANTTHGMPLTLAERKAAARKLLHGTKFSDRRIADICGISAKTIADMRPKPPTAESPQLEGKRAGADGKNRPASGEATKAQRAAIVKMAREHPDLSNTEIARRLGCSATTVANVKAQTAERGTSPSTSPAPNPGDAASSAGSQDEAEGAPARALGLVPDLPENAPTDPTVGEALHPCPVPGQWASDPACQQSEAGQGFAKFMDRRLVRKGEDVAVLGPSCPATYRIAAAREAQQMADYWTALASSLNDHVQLQGVETS